MIARAVAMFWLAVCKNMMGLICHYEGGHLILVNSFESVFLLSRNKCHSSPSDIAVSSFACSCVSLVGSIEVMS